MEQAKPTPLVRNEAEILHTYRMGLIRADLFVDELRDCEIGRYDLTATHSYLLEKENLRGVHLRKLHGMSIKTADVGTAQVGETLDKAKVCRHFCRFFRCKFGDKCTFVHPQKIKDLLSADIIKPVPINKNKQKRGICKLFAAGKHCPYGERCMFKHEKPEANSAETATAAAQPAAENNSYHFDVSMITVNNAETTCDEAAADKPAVEAAADLKPQDFMFENLEDAEITCDEAAAEAPAEAAAEPSLNPQELDEYWNNRSATAEELAAFRKRKRAAEAARDSHRPDKSALKKQQRNRRRRRRAQQRRQQQRRQRKQNRRCKFKPNYKRRKMFSRLLHVDECEKKEAESCGTETTTSDSGASSDSDSFVVLI